MIRKSFIAVAACFMTLGAFGGTVAILNGGGAGVEVA